MAWLRLTILMCLLALAGFARGAEDSPRDALAAVKTVLGEIDDELKLDTLSDGELSVLRGRVDPLAGRLQGVIVDLAPRLEASRKRLIELKPKGPAANPDPAADELKTEQANFDALDADLRSARAAMLQVDDYVARISSRRRDIFTRETFARAYSLLSPVLWLQVLRELPGDVRAFEALAADVGARLQARATYGQIGGFLGVILALLALAAPVGWSARRVLASAAQAQGPGRLRKALLACWKLAVLATLPLAALGVFSYALDAFDISDPRLQGVVDAVLDGLGRIAFANACARALLAPGLPDWRLPKISNEAAVKLTRLTLGVAAAWSIARLVEAVAGSVLSYNVLVLTRGLSALVIAALVAMTFQRLARAADSAAARDGGRPGRMFVWLYLLAIFGCALLGYIALATYLVEHALQFAGAAAALYLADTLAEAACERLLATESVAARVLMATLGLRRGGLEQIVVVAQGLVRLATLAAGLAVAVGPFGLPSQDLWISLRNAYFGVSVGGVTISISSIIAAALAFVLVLAATRTAQGWLAERYLPATGLDSGVKNSINTIFGYIGVVAALTAAGARLGLDPERLAWVAGGLSVGIGFGLQGIVNNFIAGLILLWERGIRVGDLVVVGVEQGFVRRINARATEIETFERATLIVPNLTLVTGAVKNWMHTDRVSRLIVNVHAAYESDPEAVRTLLIDAARAQDAVLTIPAPLALFVAFGEWAMKFELIVYVDDVVMAERVRSELNFDIMARMKAAGLRIPYPFPTANVETERGPNTSRLG